MKEVKKLVEEKATHEFEIYQVVDFLGEVCSTPSSPRVGCTRRTSSSLQCVAQILRTASEADVASTAQSVLPVHAERVGAFEVAGKVATNFCELIADAVESTLNSHKVVADVIEDAPDFCEVIASVEHL